MAAWFTLRVHNNTLDSLIGSVADRLDRTALQVIADLRAPPDAEERMAWLAERANEGLLTAEERSEYVSCATFSNFLGLLQSKARRKLASPA